MKPAHNPASLRHFLCEKLYYFVLFFALLACLLLFLLALRTRAETIIVVVVFFTIFGIVVPASEYYRRRTFYQKLLQNIASLDRAYLVLETLSRPNFYDGAILYEALYAINKSMAEVVQNYEIEAGEFRDYIEMWIHEVKTPLATLNLMNKDRKIAAQLARLDTYVEQVLYFARAENAEHDYLIKPTSLAKVISSVATKNRDTLLASNIDFVVDTLDYEVFTDSKWLEFILGQILQNSIKYQSKTIKTSAVSDDEKTTLRIVDDGIGISAKDLPRVFDKSFTGENGHDTLSGHRSSPYGSGQKSTGMGLYIAKTLCDKLGHQISISSPAKKPIQKPVQKTLPKAPQKADAGPNQKGTVVEISFLRHDYYTIMRPEKSATENHTPAPKNHTPTKANHAPSPAKHDNAAKNHTLSKK